jgi:hypothetical protein
MILADSRDIQDWIDQLKDENPEVRKNAIMQIGRNKAVEGVIALGNVSRDDPIPELRELAQKTGRYIRQLQEKAQQQKQAEAAAKKEEETAATRINVPQKNIDSAKILIAEALTLNIAGENPRAIKGLKRALTLNPLLAEDTYFTGIAASVVGGDPAEVINVLRDNKQMDNLVKSQKTQARQAVVDKHMDEAKKISLGNASFDVIIFLLINLVGPVILFIVLAQSMDTLLQTSGMRPGDIDPSLRNVRSFTELINPTSLLLFAAASTVVSLLILFLQLVFIHLLVKYFFRGTGTFSYLTYKLTSIYNVIQLSVYLLFCLIFGVLLANDAGIIMLCVGPVAIIYLMYLNSKVGKAISGAYNISNGLGCMTVMLVNISSVTIVGLVWLVFGGLLTQLSLQAFNISSLTP